MSAVAIGIDLGTTYSCVGVFKNDQVEIIANDQGNRTTPSYVAFTDSERLIGDAAKNQVARNPHNTVFDAKRLIGRKFSDSVVQSDMKHWPFKVINKGDDKPLIQVQFHGETKTFTPEEVSSMVLVKMKETAEAYLGEKVQKAVVTVPAYFNDSQRQATKDAGMIAGLDVLRIINEPTAAAIAYGLDTKSSQGLRKVLIFDLGGGTFDVTLLEIDGGIFEVKATAGDTHLGGEDFDNRLVDYFATEFKTRTGADCRGNARAVARLRAACERTKRTLSSATQATVEIDALYDGHDFSSRLTRARFEGMCRDLFDRCLDPLRTLFAEGAEMNKNEVDAVVLVGGSTRIPEVQNIVSNYFGGKELNKSINPDEAVAYGAAVQAYVLAGGKSKQTEGLLLLDVTPLTLGVETAGGVMTALIKRNTTVPVSNSMTFSNNADNQTSVDVKIYQGERPLVSQCELLGTFTLTGIPPRRRGQARIDVDFSVDSNGILIVTAEDKEAGMKNAITVQNDTGHLSKTQIEKMVQEAERFAKQDQENSERIEARNNLENYTYSMINTMNDPEVQSGIEADDRNTIMQAVNAATAWLEENPEATTEELKEHIKSFEGVAHPILSEFYKKRALTKSSSGEGQNDAAAAGTGSAEGNTAPENAPSAQDVD